MCKLVEIINKKIAQFQTEQIENNATGKNKTGWMTICRKAGPCGLELGVTSKRIKDSANPERVGKVVSEGRGLNSKGGRGTGELVEVGGVRGAE